MNVVIVESPSKAKTIMKYLGEDYKVLASYGHIRDIPSKSGMVVPENQFQMMWQETAGSEKNIAAIKAALKNAKKLYLATDPDREGEAISWHVFHVLNESGLLKDIDVKRVVFYEITKKAVLEAIQNNAVDMAEVNRLHKQLTEETVICMFGVWDIDDVRECNPNVSDEQARNALCILGDLDLIDDDWYRLRMCIDEALERESNNE